MTQLVESKAENVKLRACLPVGLCAKCRPFVGHSPEEDHMIRAFPFRATVLFGAVALLVSCGPGAAGVGNKNPGTGNPPPTTGNTDGGGGNPPGQCFDADHDGYTTCAGDCDDNDPNIYPGATEVLNGKDDDCDGKIDNHIPGRDWDGDGAVYPTDPGYKTNPSLIKPGEDCNDDNPLIGPNAINISGDPTVYDCGMGPAAGSCDSALTNGQSSAATDMAKAIGLCDSRFLQSATVTGVGAGRSIRAKFGTGGFVPKEGAKFIHISSGQSKDNVDDPNYNPKDYGSSNVLDSSGATASNPDWTPPPCGPSFGGSSAAPAHDETALTLTLKVPQNANNFSFNFAFFSAEDAEYVCSQYDDRFIADLQSQKFHGNISFDSKNNPVTVNNAFLTLCHSGEMKADGTTQTCATNVSLSSPGLLAGTGYDRADSSYGDPQAITGGSTGWLTTTSPVTPGETITLTFYVFDEGDQVLDSSVLIDNFQWGTEAVGGPVTLQ
jgi:hypothetical protein